MSNSSLTSGLTLVKFSAGWCGPCKGFKSHFEKSATDLQAQFPGLQVELVDVDEKPELVTQFGVRSVPHVILLRDGKTIATKIGSLSADVLTREMVEALHKSQMTEPC